MAYDDYNVTAVHTTYILCKFRICMIFSSILSFLWCIIFSSDFFLSDSFYGILVMWSVSSSVRYLVC